MSSKAQATTLGPPRLGPGPSRYDASPAPPFSLVVHTEHTAKLTRRGESRRASQEAAGESGGPYATGHSRQAGSGLTTVIVITRYTAGDLFISTACKLALRVANQSRALL